jgi:hypothetical protein
MSANAGSEYLRRFYSYFWSPSSTRARGAVVVAPRSRLGALLVEISDYILLIFTATPLVVFLSAHKQ